MAESLFVNVLEITVSVIPVILLLLLLSRIIHRTYLAKWNYFVWLILAVRLIVPFHLTLPGAPVSIQVPAQISQPIAVSYAVPAVSSQATIPSVTTVTPALPASSAPAGLSVMQILSIIWICGMILFLCYHFAGYFLFLHRVKRWRRPVTNPEIINIFLQKRDEMHIRRNLSIYKCSKIDTPMLVGFFKPMILLPYCSVTGEQLGAILTHELIHRRRHDLWYQLLLVGANAVHWFNPFVYLMVHQADDDLELFCDEEVVKDRSVPFRQAYGEAILSVMKQKIGYRTSFSTNFIGGKQSVKQRFVRLYDGRKRKHGITAMAILLCLTILEGTFVACTAKPTSESVNSSQLPSSSVLELSQSSEPKSMVSEQVSSSAASSSSVPAPVSPTISGMIPKSFKSQLTTLTVDNRTYSIYVPAAWTVKQTSQYPFINFFIDAKMTKNIGIFRPEYYAAFHNIADLVGMHAEFIRSDENASIKGLNNHVIKALIRRINALGVQADGDTSIRYELIYFIVSHDKTIVNELRLVSNRVNTYPSNPKDENEQAVLQKIYKDTGTSDAMIQEILQSYSEK